LPTLGWHRAIRVTHFNKYYCNRIIQLYATRRKRRRAAAGEEHTSMLRDISELLLAGNKDMQVYGKPCDILFAPSKSRIPNSEFLRERRGLTSFFT
jgi:hypothetical protein